MGKSILTISRIYPWHESRRKVGQARKLRLSSNGQRGYWELFDLLLRAHYGYPDRAAELREVVGTSPYPVRWKSNLEVHPVFYLH